MEPMERQWNCRCAPIKRGRVFPLQADSIWKRLPASDYCRGHANRSTTHPANVCVRGPAHPWAMMFRSRPPSVNCPVGIVAATGSISSIVETDGLQLGKNCANKNLCFDAKQKAVRVV